MHCPHDHQEQHVGVQDRRKDLELTDWRKAARARCAGMRVRAAPNAAPDAMGPVVASAAGRFLLDRTSLQLIASYFDRFLLKRFLFDRSSVYRFLCYYFLFVSFLFDRSSVYRFLRITSYFIT